MLKIFSSASLLVYLLASLAIAGPFIPVPNADRLRVDGHLWFDILSLTPRTQLSGAKNKFGIAYANTPNWATLCPLDSDGDGFTNGEELGDPNCVWTVGATPSRTNDLSHPGLYSSVPVDAYPGRVRTASTCLRDADGLGDNRVALRSQTLTAPASMKRLDKTERVAIARKLLPDNFTEVRASCPHLQSGLLDWHSPSTWGGTVPLALTSVTLPSNTKVLVSSCSLDPRGYLTITVPEGSQLIFTDAPIFLRVKDLIVKGEFLLGSRTCPLHSPMTISFVAEKTETAYTNGATASTNGTLRLHGTRNNFTWTRLAATILPGTAHVLLQDPVGWGPGDEIVVATSIYKDLMNNQNEMRVVESVSADGRTLFVNSPFQFKHWASLEYQTEVGLLTRSIILRGGLTSTARAAKYGGHTMAHGPNAVTEVIGVRAHRMGQQNVLGRYSFHMHLAINGNRSTLQQATCDEAYYRCVSVHKTNYTLIRKNVAYNVSANCYYLEDGSEMFNRIEHNLAVYVLPLGTPASGGAQSGEVFDEDSTAIQPADHTSAGFYISNPHNYVVGNAASGGWAGYSFPIFPYAQRLSSNQEPKLIMNPSSYPILEFDGNTAHSAGYYWGDAGCIYMGGLLTDVSGKFSYSNGRYSHPTKGIHYVTNLKTWLCNRGLSSWGERVEMMRYEAHDVRRSAVLFGESAVNNMIVTGNTANNALDMLDQGRQGFGFYDTWVQTSLTNVTFINFWDRFQSIYNRDAVIVDLDHSDIYKPWYISATRNLRMENIDNRLRIGRWIRETGASRMFNIVDWDGSLVGLNQCNATIIGSDIDWWNVGDDCWYNSNWPAWLCPRKPGREVVGIDMDLPGIQQQLDIQADTSTNQLTQAQRDQLYIGHISQFGSKSSRKLIVTRNHHTATGLSGIGWYLYLTTGVPETIRVWPQNFATTGTFILLAISYPAGTTFDVWAVPRWAPYKTRFVKVASRQAVLDGNGTMYHFDGRHLYMKVADLWSKYPNAYTRFNVSIPDVLATYVDFNITAKCLSKNALGYCTTPAAADPPADLIIPIRVCNDKLEQITPVKSTELCPTLNDTMPPLSYDPLIANISDCGAYTDQWNVWRCTQNTMINKGYCRASCNNSCRVYNQFPPRCSFMDACIKSEFLPPRADTCGMMNDQLLSDECTLKTCDSDFGNLGYITAAVGTPCNYNAAVASGICNGYLSCVARDIPSPSLPIVSRLTDRPSVRLSPTNLIEVAVSQPECVTSVRVFVQSIVANTYQSYLMTKQATSSTDVSAVYSYTASAALRRNVTIVLNTTLPGKNSTLTFRFLDWNSKSNVVPSFSAPTYTSAGSFSITVDPIDWVASAVLYSGYGSSASATSLTCDYGSASKCSVSSLLTPPAGDAYVSLTLGSGVVVKRSLPCLTADMIGSKCNTSIHTVRTTNKCKAGLIINSIGNNWVQVGLQKGTPFAWIRNITVGPTNKPLNLVAWGNVWAGNSWNGDVGGNLTLILNTGERELFWVPKYSEGRTNDALVCLAGVAIPAPDEVGASGACKALYQCQVGATPFVATTTITTTKVATTTTKVTTSTQVVLLPTTSMTTTLQTQTSIKPTTSPTSTSTKSTTQTKLTTTAPVVTTPSTTMPTTTKISSTGTEPTTTKHVTSVPTTSLTLTPTSTPTTTSIPIARAIVLQIPKNTSFETFVLAFRNTYNLPESELCDHGPPNCHRKRQIKSYKS